jgi:hypothetical protein
MTDRPQEAAPQEPAGWRLVPLQFIQGVCDLAHNYSFTAIPPDYYRGVEGDAFKDAYRRCGRELAKVRAMLTAAPQEPAEPVAPKVYLVATGEVYEGRETYTRHDVCPPLADAELLYRWLPTYEAGEDGTRIAQVPWALDAAIDAALDVTKRDPNGA